MLGVARGGAANAAGALELLVRYLRNVDQVQLTVGNILCARCAWLGGR
jgi:hypothetical protein